MLLWQPQSSKIRSVFLLSCALHMVGCFTLLFVYKDYHQKLAIDLSQRVPSQAIVKLLPLSMAKPKNQTFGSKNGSGKGAGKVSKPDVQKQKKKSLTSLKTVKQVPSKSKASGKKKGKTSLEKSAHDKKKSAQKSKLQKVVEKKLEPVQELKQIEPVKPEPVKEVQPAAQSVAAPTAQESATAPAEGQEILYLTQQEMDALQLQQKLQETLFDVWAPPVGIPAERFCELLVTVGWDGVILETKFLKKTDILIYDLSVQEAVERVAFPHEVWGKHITITFKP